MAHAASCGTIRKHQLLEDADRRGRSWSEDGRGAEPSVRSQATNQRQVVRLVVRRDDTVADQEIDHHERAVELEVVRVSDRLHHAADRPPPELGDLAVVIYRNEVAR